MTGRKKIIIYDTTLRDGEQAPGFSMTRNEKVRFAKKLMELGVNVIEAGFPVSSESDFNSVKEISAIGGKTVISALARATRNDIERACMALDPAHNPRLHIFIPSSPIQIRYQLEKGEKEVIEQAVSSVRYASRLMPDIQFSAMDGSRADPDFLISLFEAVIDEGASIINLSDTVGYITPVELYTYVANLREKIKNLDRAMLSIHCHNDLGLATANSLSALQAGAEQVECTVNGIGERSGNAALEEIVTAINVRNDQYNYYCNVKTKEILNTSNLLSEITGVAIQPNKAVVGGNAFAHGSGIHQDGVLIKAETYELYNPEMIGLDSSQIVLGRHSGRKGLLSRLKQLGVDMDNININDVMNRVKSFAEENKVVLDDDLLHIVHAQ